MTGLKSFKNYIPGVTMITGVVILLSGILAVTSHYKKEKVSRIVALEKKVEYKKRISDERLFEVLNSHNDKVFGFDVSEYQGDINWNKVGTIKNKFAVKFVFIRSSAGNNRTDKKFSTNWAKAKENNFIRGAYHYYRPDEAPEHQARQFIKNVTLEDGDLPPVLDIEREPRKISRAQLKKNLKRWLDIVEKHYGVKPIIYSGESYYVNFLKKDLKEYKFWIANYNSSVSYLEDDWLMWQFTDTAVIDGIYGHVDLNIFHGNHIKLLSHTIQKN